MESSSRKSGRLFEAVLETPMGCEYAGAVMPDDVDVPPGMEIRHLCVEGKWHVYISYFVERPEDFLTLKNTLDEIARALQLIERVSPL